MEIKNVSEKIVWLLIVSLVLSVVSLTMFTWGRYIFFLVAVMVTLIYAVQCGGKFILQFDMFQKLLIAFAFYTGLSSLWAINMSDSISKMTTLISIAICYYPIYAYYRDCGTVEYLISGIKWGGTAVCLYTIAFTGLDALMQAASSDNLRIANEFANVNTLGLCASTVIFLQIWQLIYSEGKKWELICCIPALLVMGAAQSRKSIVFLLVSIFLLYFLRYGFGRKPAKTIITLVSAVAVVIGILYITSQWKLFGGLSERMQEFLNSFTGEGKVDHSTELRNEMKNLGIEWWLKRPVFGWGVSNTHFFVRQYLGRDTYMHNNYVELLCGGGLVGLILYYAMHIYCIQKLILLRNIDKPLFSLGITWCVLMLIMDYGMVSYYSKLDLLNLMTVFLMIGRMQRERSFE